MWALIDKKLRALSFIYFVICARNISFAFGETMHVRPLGKRNTVIEL